jgi:ParB family chromosome partitioning protein
MQDEKVTEIFTDEIVISPGNMREHIDRDEIFELLSDIKKNGLINPITVRPVGDKFELVAGQRRFLAHQYGGIIKIKCVVRELTDDEALAIMTSENLARVDVNPVDEAKHVTRLMQSSEGDIKKVMHLVGRGEKWVRDRLAIGEMPDYMQELIAKKELKLGVALPLSQITDDGVRRMWTYQAVRDGANVQLAEYWLQDFKRQQLPGGSFADPNNVPENIAPPQAVMFRCAIDGKEYDTRLCKTVIIYEGNLEYFNAFVSAFRSPSPETELESGGD